MKILLVSEDVPYPSMGGLAIHALGLARALVAEGHMVDFMCGNHLPLSVAGEAIKFGGRLLPELDGHKIGWWEVRLGLFIPQKRSWLARRFARAIMRRAAAYDVVHYHGHVPNLALYLPQSLNFVQTRHDQGSDCVIHMRFKAGQVCRETNAQACAGCVTEKPSKFQRKISTLAVERYRSEVYLAFSRHKTVFVSEFLKQNLERTFGVPVPGRVVHNFVGVESVLCKNPSAAALGPSTVGERLIVFAGKLYSPKGISDLLALMVPRLTVGVRLLVIGDGPQETELKRLYADCQQLDFLGWMGRRETLSAVLACDAVVVPSICEEAFGQTTLEGLELGKPTFALNIGGTPELARYQKFEGQLSLHPTLASLVDALLRPDMPFKDRKPRLRMNCDASSVVQRLLTVYQAPAGPLSVAIDQPRR